MTGSEPWLGVHVPARPVRGVGLVLHGGRARSHQAVAPTALAALRMRPFAAALRREGSAGGLAVARLRFRVRGWNGDEQSPVADARWALDELARRFPTAPIGLVGHSMGGRTALYVADHPAVRSVVLLAPWIEAGDPVDTLAGRRVLIMHGTSDRMTDPIRSREYAERARPFAEQLTYVQVRGERHAMLRRARLWHSLAAGFTLGALWSGSGTGTVGRSATNAVAQALSGEPSLVV